MAPKLFEFAVLLKRSTPDQPWGIRLVGGSDLDTPLIVTKVRFDYTEGIFGKNVKSLYYMSILYLFF